MIKLQRLVGSREKNEKALLLTCRDVKLYKLCRKNLLFIAGSDLGNFSDGLIYIYFDFPQKTQIEDLSNLI